MHPVTFLPDPPGIIIISPHLGFLLKEDIGVRSGAQTFMAVVERVQLKPEYTGKDLDGPLVLENQYACTFLKLYMHG